MHICKIGKKEFEKLDGLRRHNSQTHKITSQETYNEYVLNGNVPTCKSGCGEIPRLVSFEVGVKLMFSDGSPTCFWYEFTPPAYGMVGHVICFSQSRKMIW